MSLRKDRRERPAAGSGSDARSVAVPPVLPVLPQIVLQAVNADTLVVTVNGDKLAATPIRRDTIAQTLTELVTRLGTPTRVEVREMDGSIHADILTPPTPEPRSPFAPPSGTPAAVRPPSLWEFTAGGFVPGEDVALALVIRHVSADPVGIARALLSRGETAASAGEVILYGRISGTTSVHRID